MADEEKNETTEETEASVEEVSDTVVSDTEVVSDTAAPAEAEAPEAVSDTESVSDTPAAAPEAPAKPSKSRRHVPRPLRRTRTKTVRDKPATRKPITRTSAPEPELGRHQERRGVVISDKGDKTIVVKVDVIKSHPRYRKVVRRSVKFHAHDETNQAGIGDTVRIVETRPLSKTKRWRLAEIVEKAR
jgi:ribosomal protein uS17